MTRPSLRVRSGEIAKWSGVPYQTLMKWDRARVLRPSGRRRKGERVYTVEDLCAAGVARGAAELGLPTEAVRALIALVQRDDNAAMARALVLTVRGDVPGFSRAVFVPDRTDPADAAQLAAWEREGRIASRATVFEIALALYRKIADDFADRLLAEAGGREGAD